MFWGVERNILQEKFPTLLIEVTNWVEANKGAMIFCEDVKLEPNR